jgi:hypothetical protein
MQACTFKLDCWLSPVTVLGLLFESMLRTMFRFAIGSSVHKIWWNLETKNDLSSSSITEKEKKSKSIRGKFTIFFFKEQLISHYLVNEPAS